MMREARFMYWMKLDNQNCLWYYKLKIFQGLFLILIDSFIFLESTVYKYVKKLNAMIIFMVKEI